EQEPPKSLLLGIGVMTLGSSSCIGETFLVVFVIYVEVLAYGTLVVRRNLRSARGEFATRRGSCTRTRS
ncbi:hypothetical protein A2U01_0111656, partial [Trifolium medium]|nr:hypothetical protein [Trifolium medium]